MRMTLTAATAIILFSGAAFAQAPVGAPPPGIPAGMGPPADAPPPKPQAPGPYAVSVESYPSLSTHTIYRPADLSAFGGNRKLPILTWGNGGCVKVGTAFSNFLTQVASHGFLAIAVGTKDAPLPNFGGARGGPPVAPGAAPAGAGAPPRMPAGGPPGMGQGPSDSLLTDAIDWAIRQSADKSSPLYGKIDTTRIAAAGQSCGGLQTIAVSADPRITTSVIFNSGTFGAGPMGMSAATKGSLEKLHAPTAYFIGGPTDIAYANAEDDFRRIGNIPVFKGNLNVGHGATFWDPGAGWFGEVGVEWLKWQLKGDQAAARYFVGADCKLCTNPLWKVEKKNMK
jgi:hypothetical protein